MINAYTILRVQTMELSHLRNIIFLLQFGKLLTEFEIAILFLTNLLSIIHKKNY